MRLTTIGVSGECRATRFCFHKAGKLRFLFLFCSAAFYACEVLYYGTTAPYGCHTVLYDAVIEHY